jgi:hypothetical protein
MRTSRSISIVTVLALVGLLVGAQSALVSGSDRTILEFNTMVGVPQAFTGTQNPIRGINGGGIPWTLASGSGELSADGRLEIRVRGLVLAAGSLVGTNPVSSFAAIVSCLASDATVSNVMTATFPATTGPASTGGGNARFEGALTLPQPCIAPIVFVTSPGGSWFASTGG